MKYISRAFKKIWNNVLFFKVWIQNCTKYLPPRNQNLASSNQTGLLRSLQTTFLAQRAKTTVKTAFRCSVPKVPTSIHTLLVKLTLLFVVALILYFRPLYCIVFMLILSFEYISIVSYLLDIYRNYDDFCELRMEKVDTCDKNSLELWLFYCKALAFLRVYNTLERNKISLKNFLLFSVIVIFAIPLRFLRLVYFLLKSGKSVRENLEYLCADIYYKSKDMRIEIYKGKIYLNCHTLGHLVRSISTVYKTKNSEQLIASVTRLSGLSKELKLDNTKLVALKKSWLITGGEKTIPFTHYTHVSAGSAMHATSNLPDDLEEGQRADIPMVGTIKEGAKRPGTVISPRPWKIIESQKKLFVPQHSIETIENKHDDIFPFHEETEKINAERAYVFRDALIRIGLESIDDQCVIDPLVMGLYSRAFENCSAYSIGVEVKAMLKDEIIQW